MPVDWNEFQPVTEPKESTLDWSQFSPIESPSEDKTKLSQLAAKIPEVVQDLGLDFPKQIEGLSKEETERLNSIKKDIVLKEAGIRLKESPLKSIARGAGQFTSEAVQSLTTPQGIGLAAVTAASPVVGAGLMSGLAAKTIGEGAGRLSVPGGSVQEAVKDILNMAAMTAGAKGAAKLAEKPSTPEVTDASKIGETEKVHGAVRPQPEQSVRQVPVEEGGKGVQLQGAAKESQVPLTEPTTEVVKPETSEQTSLGITTQSPILSRIADFVLNPGESLKSIGTTLKGLGGYSLPKTTAAHSETGELGVRYASSRQAARPLAEVFASGTLVGTGVDPVKFGAALTEDNLRSVRKGFEDQAKDLLSKGDEEGAAAAVASAQQVHSLIGGKNSPFKTEADYQKYLEQPDVQQAVKQHIKQWEETIDPQFKAAQNIDPDVTLPTRGLQTGARINLKAILEDERGVSPVGSGGSLTATFKKKSPFGVAAKGTGQEYESNYGEIVHNTFHRQLEIANKNKFDQSLVSSGNAKIDRPGQTITLGGERTTPFPLQRKVVITNKDGTTTTFNKNENIYVKNSLADEYRSASGVDKKYRLPGITPVMNVLNRAALAGLTDFTVHLSNQMTALFNRPVSGKLLTDSLLSVTGRADVPVTLAKAIFKSFKDNSKQIAELSEIGAMRDVSFGLNPLGKILGKTDQVTRLLLDDTFKSLVDQGLVENTETARREYVNQIGQYNRRLQGRLTRLARDTGFGPFATAGKTFNALGVKMVTLSPGAPSSGGLAEASLRANVLSKFVGATVLIGGINYLLTSNAGGGVMGRPGVPIGNLDTGKNDHNGNPLSIPLLDILGLGRGLRVTGIRGIAQSKYLGLPNEVALDAAARDIINSSVAPFAGPGPRFASVTATGSPIAVNVGRTAPVSPPGKNQLAVNFLAAAKDANPVVKSLVDRMVDGKSMREALVTQLPRFTLTSGKPPEMVENYPEIVHKAQLNAYLNDIVHRSRRMSPEKRDELIESTLDSLEGEDRLHAMRFFKYRRVQ